MKRTDERAYRQWLTQMGENIVSFAGVQLVEDILEETSPVNILDLGVDMSALAVTRYVNRKTQESAFFNIAAPGNKSERKILAANILNEPRVRMEDCKSVRSRVLELPDLFTVMKYDFIRIFEFNTFSIHDREEVLKLASSVAAPGAKFFIYPCDKVSLNTIKSYFDNSATITSRWNCVRVDLNASIKTADTTPPVAEVAAVSEAPQDLHTEPESDDLVEPTQDYQETESPSESLTDAYEAFESVDVESEVESEDNTPPVVPDEALEDSDIEDTDDYDVEDDEERSS